MTDVNVNLNSNMDKLGKYLKGNEVDKEKLSTELAEVFENIEDNEGKADFNDMAVQLIAKSDTMRSKDVLPYFDVLEQFASMDGDKNSFSKTELDLMQKVLHGESIEDTLVSLDEQKVEYEKIKAEEEKKKELEKEQKNNPSSSNTDSNAAINDREAELLAEKLYDAMDGWGTDEKAVEEVLYDNSLSSADIVKIMNTYESMYGKSLEKEIREDYSWMTGQSKLLNVLETAEKEVKEESKNSSTSLSLSDREINLYAENLYEAMKGLGTDETAVEEVLYDSSLSSADIAAIMDVYEEKYGKTLEKEIKGDFSGKREDDLLEVLEKAQEDTQ